MDKSHKIKTQGRRKSGGPSVCRKSLAEFARSRRQLCCHTDAACPLRVRCPQAAEENQPQGSLLAAQPLWPTLQTCHRHVCLRCGVGKTLCAERASQVLPGTEAQAQRIPPWRKRRQPFSTVSRAAGFPAAPAVWSGVTFFCSPDRRRWSWPGGRAGIRTWGRASPRRWPPPGAWWSGRSGSRR